MHLSACLLHLQLQLEPSRATTKKECTTPVLDLACAVQAQQRDLQGLHRKQEAASQQVRQLSQDQQRLDQQLQRCRGECAAVARKAEALAAQNKQLEVSGTWERFSSPSAHTCMGILWGSGCTEQAAPDELLLVQTASREPVLRPAGRLRRPEQAIGSGLLEKTAQQTVLQGVKRWLGGRRQAIGGCRLLKGVWMSWWSTRSAAVRHALCLPGRLPRASDALSS